MPCLGVTHSASETYDCQADRAVNDRVRVLCILMGKF